MTLNESEHFLSGTQVGIKVLKAVVTNTEFWTHIAVRFTARICCIYGRYVVFERTVNTIDQRKQSQPESFDMDEKHHALLTGYHQDEDSDSEFSVPQNNGFRMRNNRGRGRLTWLLEHSSLALAVLITTLYVAGTLAFMIAMYMQGSFQLRSLNPPYSPAMNAIHHVVQKKHATDGPTIFGGPPSDEQFDAWMNLVEPGLIRASYEEMQLGQEDPTNSVELWEGGYLASLGVYHELHCLRRLKLYLYKDIYYPNLDQAEQEYEVSHLGRHQQLFSLDLIL
ncbi:hypothetical protein MMC12_006180 [Toensbergia leucococca]|nr:hypothetical protein [Toensbergia leucococca]